MRKEILINGAANETRIAITEDGRLAEIFVETSSKEKMVGDIYLGRIAKVMPGIKAAFIDLGLQQDLSGCPRQMGHGAIARQA